MCVPVWNDKFCNPLSLFSPFRQGVVGREPFPLPSTPAHACIDPSESYYEEAQPYGEAFNGKNWQLRHKLCIHKSDIYSFI